MKWLKRLKERVWGQAPKGEQSSIPLTPTRRLDQGPAEKWYLRQLFPNSVFTKKMTPGRRRILREIMRRLRPDQLEIVYRFGWNKGERI
jgi:hypothetical protein